MVGCLIQCEGSLVSNKYYELFRLFVSCRRTLKNIIIASCEEKTECSQSSLIPMLSEDSDFVLWLFKSVVLVIGIQEAVLDHLFHEIRDMSFSLMDHTSYIFLTLSKLHFRVVVNSFIFSEKDFKEPPSSDVASENNNLKESGLCVDSFKDVDAWKCMLLVLENLEQHAQSLLMSVEDALCDGKSGIHLEVVSLNKLSSVVSCFNGILLGLASVVNHINAEKSDKGKSLWWKSEPISKINLSINVFSDFISSILCILVVEDDRPPGCSGELSLETANCKMERMSDKQHQKLGARTCSAAFNIDDDDSTIAGVGNSQSQLEGVNCPANCLSKGDLIELQCLKMQLLGVLLKGANPEAANLLRQLLVAASSILRLNLQISGTPFASSLVPISVGISKFLLLQLADMVGVPHPFNFVLLDGVLVYLEELGSHFPLTNPTLTRNMYAELIELHLRAIGKCIYLQGKKATLASHERESSTKILDESVGLSEVSRSHGPHCLDEFKSRLRMSFKVLIQKPSDLHLLSAVQAIERALVGVQEGSTMIYQISTGSGDGGKVSSIVAAGIDCLDLIIEHAQGNVRSAHLSRSLINIEMDSSY